MDKVDIRRAFLGAFPARWAIPYVLVVYAFFVGMIIVAIALYPAGYSIFTNAVSNLGNQQLNTLPGWLVFSIGLWTFGIIVFPLMCYITRRLASGQRFSSIIFFVFSVVACMGSIGVGIFSEIAATNDAHVVMAAMAFGGLFLAATVSWVPCFLIALRTQPRSLRNARLAITVVQMVVVIFIAAMTINIYAQEKLLGIVGNGFLSVTFWEWMLLLGLGIHLFLLTVNVNLGTK